MKFNYRKKILCVLVFILCTAIMCACGKEVASDAQKGETTGKNEMDLSNKEDNTQESSGQKRDNTPVVLEPCAEGKVVYGVEGVCVDASNLSEGYIMICYTGDSQKVRMLLDTPTGATYNYLIPTDGSYAVFPMSDGDGDYQIGIYENISDDKYAELFSQSITVELEDEKKVFLYPNRYVDFNSDSETVKKSAEIVADACTDLEAVRAVFTYVTNNVTYDYEKAETVQAGYLPVVDETLRTGKGICFDYASLMAAMLRSQRIPARLEIGYAGTLYHAWISVFIKDEGWIEDYIVFDGTDWVLMDPTLVSSAKASAVKKQMENADSYYDMQYKY